MLYQENDWVYVISEDSKEGFIPYRFAIILTLAINANPHIDEKEMKMKKNVFCSYCAQFGSQLAGLALNVKKKMPRGEVTFLA